MTSLALPRFSPATRVAMGLVSLMISLILLVDLFVGFLPDRAAEAKRRHLAAATVVAAQVAHALRHGETDAVQDTLNQTAADEPQLRSAAILAPHDRLIASVGEHARWWTLARGEVSTLDNVRAAITADGQPWGELQMAFAPTWPQTLQGWLRDPLLRGLVLISLLGFVAFQLYLRRVLRYLDPESAVPERVRRAFDTLTEGVLVLDGTGRILLANTAFRCQFPQPGDLLTGSDIGTLDWLVPSLAAPGAERPWRRALADGKTTLGTPLRFEVPGATPRELVMNCAPIRDSFGRTRGCLATFSDVTELHERTQRLRIALEELNASQAEIEKKNEALTHLATRDALTGSLNRRSFMDQAEVRFAEALARATPLCVIMCDIDHFKSVNDRFGHAAGDRVIQAAVKALALGLRAGDLLCRYGGEEFCILLRGATIAQALEIAERLRADAQAHIGDAIREPAGIKVTMSFGVAELRAGMPDPAHLIDRADQALYLSKKGGRNRVTSERALLATQDAHV